MFKNHLWKPLIFILFSITLLLCLFIILPSRFPEVNLDGQNLAGVLASVAILLLLFYRLLQTHGLLRALGIILIWKIIFLFIIIGYVYRFEMQGAGYRILAVLSPSSNWTNEKGQIMISRSRDGHFYTSAQVNGVTIKFMIDTGASDVALTKEAAAALKFDLSKLKYTRSYATANGMSSAAPVRLAQFKIGNKIFEDVGAHIGTGELDISLLGMSVLGRFKSFNIDKDILKLSY